MYTIEVNSDMVDTIVEQQLKDTLKTFEYDLECVKENRKGVIFSKDVFEDVEEIKKHIKAVKLLLNWYTLDNYDLENI